MFHCFLNPKNNGFKDEVFLMHVDLSFPFMEVNKNVSRIFTISSLEALWWEEKLLCAKKFFHRLEIQTKEMFFSLFLIY